MKLPHIDDPTGSSESIRDSAAIGMSLQALNAAISLVKPLQEIRTKVQEDPNAAWEIENTELGIRLAVTGVAFLTAATYSTKSNHVEALQGVRELTRMLTEMEGYLRAPMQRLFDIEALLKKAGFAVELVNEGTVVINDGVLVNLRDGYLQVDHVGYKGRTVDSTLLSTVTRFLLEQKLLHPAEQMAASLLALSFNYRVEARGPRLFINAAGGLEVRISFLNVEQATITGTGDGVALAPLLACARQLMTGFDIQEVAEKA